VAGTVQLLVRPQEVVASVQALAQAYDDYYGAIADFNRAQFRLYRALGQPAQALSSAAQACTPPEAARTAAEGRAAFPASPPVPVPAPGERRASPIPIQLDDALPPPARR
jgi:hypothetical protein